MIWNVYFQVAGFLLILIVIVLCYSQKRLNFKAERAFSSVLWNCLVSSLLDLLAVIAINFSDTLGHTVTQIVIDLYLLSILSVGCHAAWFAVDEIRYSFRKRIRYLTPLPVVAQAIVCAMFETSYVKNVETYALFSYGIPIFAVNVFCGLYIASTLIMTIILRKQITKGRRYVIYSWLIIWFIAGLVQILIPQALVISFSMGIACIFMYCKLENPETLIDDQTGLFNKRGFQLKMEEQLKKNARDGLVSISFTNMNVITEIFGNKMVKKLNKQICDFADKCESTIAFKLDDNIITLLYDSKDDIEGILEYFIKRFEQPWTVNEVHILVNATISCIENVSMFNDVEELEETIYYFAIDGKKRPEQVIRIDNREIELKKRRTEVQHALEWALRNDAVEVYYQPIYNIEKGCFSTMEALVRIRDENGTVIPPGEFIEFAEKNGMILKLGEMIFRKVCDFIRRMRIEEYGIEFIDVNLSVVQCMQEELAREFKNIMGEYQIPPHRIVLEITETAAIASQKTLDRNMKELIDYGTAFSLDDYGSGYSNLAYIVELPVKIIKIDREITIAYSKSEKARIATEHTIKMIHDLGMEIIVEGVETEAEYIAFKKLGVDYIQGFYFSKPLPKERVLNYIQEWL